MPKTKEQKKQIIKDLEKIFSDHDAKILIDFSGLNSDKLFDFKHYLKEINCSMMVVKKTLLEKVLEKLGKNEIANTVKGIKKQLALVFGKSDKITKAKACDKLSQDSDADILGGIEEDSFLSKETIVELAKLPSAEEIRTRLVMSLTGPLASFINVLKGNIKGLLVSLSAINKQK